MLHSNNRKVINLFLASFFAIFTLVLLINFFQKNYFIRDYYYGIYLKNETQIPITKELKLSSNDKLEINDNLFNEFNNSFSEILKGKSLEDSIALIKTIKFMLMNVDEYDPDLLKFVSSLIKRPSNKPLSLSNPRGEDYSQMGQSTYLNNQIFKNKTKGFFIESGAHDGEYLSNTLYFEKKFQWTGLLIEPIYNSFQYLMKKNRNVFALNACISDKRPLIAKFRSANVYSGREQLHEKKYWNHISNVVRSNANEYVPCFSLNTILAAINVNKIDFFSLDIEGGEWDVVKSINYEKLDINLFCIEWGHLGEKKQILKDHLLKNGYKFVVEREIDYYFQKI